MNLELGLPTVCGVANKDSHLSGIHVAWFRRQRLHRSVGFLFSFYGPGIYGDLFGPLIGLQTAKVATFLKISEHNHLQRLFLFVHQTLLKQRITGFDGCSRKVGAEPSGSQSIDLLAQEGESATRFRFFPGFKANLCRWISIVADQHNLVGRSKILDGSIDGRFQLFPHAVTSQTGTSVYKQCDASRWSIKVQQRR